MREAQAIARVSAVAGAQLGLFTRDEAQDAGLTRARLRGLVERGIVERVAPNVFRFVAAARSWHQRVLAAVLDGGPECLASHRTAAALHAFDGFRPSVIEVVVPMRLRHVRKDVLVHHTRALSSADRSSVAGIPVTSRVRTLIDLGAIASAATVEEAVDGAERDRAVSRVDLEGRYRELRVRGRNGIGAMTQILDGRSAVEQVPRSVLERRMLRLLRRAGLPVPDVGHGVRLESGIDYELDFAFVDDRLALEVDGHGSHATRSQRAADDVRAGKLGDLGWRLRRFTYEQVMYKPAAVASAVRSALGSHPPIPHLKQKRVPE